MNKVLLLLYVGVIIVHALHGSEKVQINEIEDIPQQKPPELLWDPEKRMWSYDDDDFYSKDYSGDDDDGATPSDFTFSDNSYNDTFTIENEESAEEQTYNINSTNNAICSFCDVSKNKTQTYVVNSLEHQSLPVAQNKSGNVDDFVKYEEKTDHYIDSPLSQELELPTNKVHNNVETTELKPDESHPNIAVEVNPATEYPLWAFEFESNRTRPLKKEIINKSTADQNVHTDNIIGVTRLQVLPSEDNDEHQHTAKNSNITKNSPIINIKPFSKDTKLPIKSAGSTQEFKRNNFDNKDHNIVVDIPEYHNFEQVTNETKWPVSIKTDNDISLAQNVNTNSHFENNSREKSMIELSPEVIMPEDPLLNNDMKVDIKQPTCLECNINSSSEQKNNLIGIPSRIVTEIFTTLHSVTNTINETNKDEVFNPVIPLSTSCSSAVTTVGETTLHWPKTLINVTTTSQELCLDKDGIPVTRTCLNGEWSASNGSCLNTTVPTRTLLLTELLSSKYDSHSVAQNLTQVTTDTSNITSHQIYLMSQLLEKISYSPHEAKLDDVAQSISNIMHYESAQLALAQCMLNSTDKILYSLDNFLLKTNSVDSGYRSIVTEKLLVQEANLLKVDFSGFKVASSSSESRFQVGDLTTLNQNHNAFNANGSLDLALLIPDELRKAIKECRGSRANPNIISTVFYDDSLFNNNEGKGHSEGKIISVLLPGFNCSFNAPLQIIYKPINNSKLSEQKCAYWQYGSNEKDGNIKGQWIFDGTPKPFLNTTYQLCEFWHVTHFSLLVLGDLAINISEADKHALDIITAVGSGLSLLGLLAVFVTAITFRSYRSANAVVIHFSVAMTAQIILLFIADNTNEEKLLCTIFGAALHYVVLSQFCWMLTIALLQYKRYVLVFSNPTKYLMAKACAFAWGFPLIPVIVIVSISSDNYTHNSYGLCYAVGNYFIFGVLIPVATIVFINLLVFLRIMIYIASRKIKAHRKMDNATSLQLRLAIMLYFLLGLTWGFGLIAAIGGGVVYSYLFCITATLQGFVLFLFFIALSDKTRSLWGSSVWCPCLDKKRKYDVNTDSSSHPMVRRPTSTNTSDTFPDGTGNDMFQKYKNRKSTDF